MTSAARATTIDGVYVFEPTIHRDERGWFSRTHDAAWCAEAGLESQFVHHNQSRSHRGVLRGLHVRAGLGESKIVRCARGAITDYVVDTRPWSTTFGRVERFELDDVALHQLFLSPFIAHGFQVVSELADVCYLHSRSFEPGAEISIAWNDPTLGLEWPITPPITSTRDASAPSLDSIELDRLFHRPGSS